MKYKELKKYIYEYAVLSIAKELDISMIELLSKIDGQIEFTGTEIILMSQLIGIKNPEQIFFTIAVSE